MSTNNMKKNPLQGNTMNRIALIGALMLITGFAQAGTLTRTSSFAYDSTTGLLIQEVIEPDNTALKLQTDYTYDGYGNKLTVTVSGADITTRTTRTTYDAKGQFPVTTTNALNQSDTGAYDARFGKPTSLTGPNGLTTTWSYDGFGRKVNETRADATQTNVAFNTCDGTCPSGAQYYIATTTSGAPTSTVYYDMLSREIRSQAQGFDGRLITKDTYYDSLGRVDHVAKPYYAGDTALYSYYQYDAIGRVLVETLPDNTTKSMSYNGLTTSVTNAKSQTETRVKNSQGQLVSVTDAANNVISYQYDPFGNLTKTTDAKGNVVTLTYDLRGRKVAMNDPDMGNWSYQYDVLGQLKQQTDAKGQIVTMTYDVLGRMLTRNEPDLKSTWVYDTAVKGIGKLTQVSSDNGWKRVYTYDSLGRPSSEATTIDVTYTVTKTYDSYGRTLTATYPTGFASKNVYNAYGYLAEVRNNATNALYWKGNAKDADGHVINETAGNNVITQRSYDNATGRLMGVNAGLNGSSVVQSQNFVYDVLGNLTARQDVNLGTTETAVYDNLNRLNSLSKNGVTVSVTYDSIGNITYKSDVGSYAYGAKPHAVSQVTGTMNATYTYDANGNLISGNGRTVTVTSFNMPSSIVQGAVGTPLNNTVTLLYDANHERMKQVNNRETMYYLNPRIDIGGHYEKEVIGRNTYYRHYIYGGNGLVAMVTTGASTGTSYFHTDHLGSIAVVTNDTGAVVDRYTYDAWGKRTAQTGSLDDTHHGFTAHEHLDSVGLIHMNGRVYDPALARFMSADPYVQDPANLQSYNRYSYGWNNPLSGADPSGYSWWTKIRSTVVRVIAAVADAYGCSGYCSAAVGAYQGYKAGGLTGGVVGGITGYLGYQTSVNYPLAGSDGIIWDNVARAAAINAAMGCANGAATGGSCGNGAVSGAIGTVGNAYGFMGSVIAGCAAGKITGGSCGDGALNAVASYVVYSVASSAAKYAIEAQKTDSDPTKFLVGDRSFGMGEGSVENSIRSKLDYIGTKVRVSGDPELIRAFDALTVAYKDYVKSIPGRLSQEVFAEATYGKDSVVIYKGWTRLNTEEKFFALAHEIVHLTPTNHFLDPHDLTGKAEVHANSVASKILGRPVPERFRGYGEPGY